MKALPRLCTVFALAAVLVPVTPVAKADFVVFNFDPGQAGNQGYGGELGNDFTVNMPVLVTQVGVFDALSDGISGTLKAQIWTRNGNTGTLVPGTTLSFDSADPGTLVGSVRLKPLPTPVLLDPGTYTIASNGHSAADMNLNSNAGGFPFTKSDGGGLLTVPAGPGVQAKRWGAAADIFPNNADGDWLYGAGTFAFQPAGDYPAYAVSPGTVGTQNNFGGSLGMDFVAHRPMQITHLGVFDSGQDGLGRDITVRLYARGVGSTPDNVGDDWGTELVSMTLSGTDGELVGGSRLVELPEPTVLPGGFAGTIVASNYGAAEPNGNSGGPVPTNWITWDGNGTLAFVGAGRWGNDPSAFPGNIDGGPANRYAAGTFVFNDDVVGLRTGSVSQVSVPNFSFEQPGRPEQPAGGYYGSDTVAWNPSAGTNAGDYHPDPPRFTDPIPDGVHAAWVNSGALRSDPLAETLQADTLYILDVDWGRRTDGIADPAHSMSLLAGGTILGWLNNTNMGNGPGHPLPAPGEWQPARAYFTANHNAAIGDPLAIDLSGGGAAQANFDNVRLTKITDAAVLLNNPSFELDNIVSTPTSEAWRENATGWVASGAGGGVYEFASQIVAADGEQSAFIRGGGSLTQTLEGVALEPGRYILLAEVGDRYATSFGGYQLELLAGGDPIAMTDDSDLAVGVEGAFYVTAAIDMLIADDHPLIGEDLGIRLTALGSGTQTYFDNVRLFSVLPSAVAVPEPSSLVLAGLALVGLVAFARRRQKP